MMKCWEHRNHNTWGCSWGYSWVKSWQKHHTMGQTHVNYGDISSYRWNWTHLVWEKSSRNVMQWDTYSQQYDILGAPPNGVYCLFWPIVIICCNWECRSLSQTWRKVEHHLSNSCWVSNKYVEIYFECLTIVWST